MQHQAATQSPPRSDSPPVTLTAGSTIVATAAASTSPAAPQPLLSSRDHLSGQKENIAIIAPGIMTTASSPTTTSTTSSGPAVAAASSTPKPPKKRYLANSEFRGQSSLLLTTCVS